MAAWRYSGGTIASPGDPEYVDGFQVSFAELFEDPGRPASNKAAHSCRKKTGLVRRPSVIISDSLWQRLFGGRADAIGKPLVYDEKTYSVVGIAPPDFRLNESQADVFTPLGKDASPVLQNRERHAGINVVARIQPGATISQARSELALTGLNLAAQYPESNAGRTFIAQPFGPHVGDVSSTLWLLLGAVGVVLLIACANVANLLLARAASREREFAMRVALGASRGRIVRQCLTESAMLGLAGAVLGVLLAAPGCARLSCSGRAVCRAPRKYADWHVLLFALAVSLLSGVFFGLAPALRIPARQSKRRLAPGPKGWRGARAVYTAALWSRRSLWR